MKERPILFSAPMVRALLAGTKTQTRRVVKPQPPADWDRNCWYRAPVWGWTRNEVPSAEWHKVRCPYGQPGDRLWVREAFMHEPADYCWEASVSIPCRPAETVYRADHDGDTRGAGWKPSIHMPRALSRITLEVTAVRVDRLQDISDAHAVAEGVSPRQPAAASGIYITGQYRLGFRDLWESINGPGSWDANPWVWVVEFQRVLPASDFKGVKP